MYHAIMTTVQDSNKFSRDRETRRPSAMFAAKGVCTGHEAPQATQTLATTGDR